MFPCLWHAVFFKSDDGNWTESSRDQTYKVNQKKTKWYTLRCEESLRQMCSIFSTSPFTTLPEANPRVSLWTSIVRLRVERLEGELWRGSKGRERKGKRTGDRHWQKGRMLWKVQCTLRGPRRRHKTISFQTKIVRIKDKKTLTSVVNNICPKMSYDTMQKQLLKEETIGYCQKLI